jgi:hypothetical protein
LASGHFDVLLIGEAKGREVVRDCQCRAVVVDGSDVGDNDRTEGAEVREEEENVVDVRSFNDDDDDRLGRTRGGSIGGGGRRAGSTKT